VAVLWIGELLMTHNMNLASYPKEKLKEILSHVGVLERKILILRFGLDTTGNPRTIETVGGMLGMTRGAIRQHEARAMKELMASGVLEEVNE
jgi:RNA polymerase primary sigma factor